MTLPRTGFLLDDLQWDIASKVAKLHLLPAPCLLAGSRMGNWPTVINEPMRLSWGTLNWQTRRVFGWILETRGATLSHLWWLCYVILRITKRETEPGINRTLPDSLQGSWRKRPPALCCLTGCWIKHSSSWYTVYGMINCGPGEDPAWGWLVLILSEGLFTQA